MKYLKLYPEHISTFHNYYKLLGKLKNEIYNEYVNYHILKQKEKMKYPNELYKLHGFYLKTNEKITFKRVSTFVDTIHNGRLIHLIKDLSK